jgi:hypothetical protein
MASLPFYIVAGLSLFAPPGSATSTSIKQMLQDFLSQGDLSALPEVGSLGGRLDVLRSEPVAEVREILPIALSLLRSENQNHQSVGTMALIAIALRPDSAELLGSDTPELVTLLSAHDQTHSGTALGLLALLKPKPPATLVPYLLPRLLDSKAPREKLLALSGVLLAAAPDDPAVIGAILNLLQDHPDMRPEVVRMMGAAHAVTERTIALFGAGLVDTDPNVRLMAVQAVGRQRPDVIQHFGPQLRRIAEDSKEKIPTRQYAALALKQINPQ